MNLIDCRECDSPYCDGCNLYRLSTALRRGKLNWMMDYHHSIQIPNITGEDYVIVLPCKVGDTVYIVDRGKISEEEVLAFSTFKNKKGETITAMTVSYGYYIAKPNIRELGVLHHDNRLSFFFSRDEAERALEVRLDA